MKRSELRNLLTSNGVENPSKELIDAVLDAVSEENATAKENFDNQIKEKETQITNLNAELEKAKKSDDRVAKADYDKVVSEKQELVDKIAKDGKKAIIKKFNVDDDFLDLVLGKVEAGKDDKEFETNVEKFVKENPKYTTTTKFVNSNPNLNGGKSPEGKEATLAGAIAEAYNSK